MKKIIIIILIVIILILLIGFLILKSFKVFDKFGMVNKIEHGKYLKITYSASGNSNGNVDYIELDLVKKELHTSYKEYHNEKLQENTYKVSDKDIEEIIKNLDDNNVIGLSTYENEEGFYPLDGPSNTLSIICSDKTYSIDGYIDFPGNGNQIYGNLTEKLYTLKK